MKATNIKWDVGLGAMMDVLEEIIPETASELLSNPAYKNMTTSEKYDYVDTYARINPELVRIIMQLPEEVDIPDDVDDIADWLADEYEFTVLSFNTREEKTLHICEKTLKRINALCSISTEQVREGLGLDEDVDVYTVEFDDGNTADLRFVIDDNFENPFVEMILYDKNGYEVSCSDIEDDAGGLWIMESDDSTYYVNVTSE